MHDNPEMKPYLARLSELFEAEGDAETARALMDQVEAQSLGGLLEGEVQRAESLTAQAEHACRLGDYEWAKLLLLQALDRREATLGPDHLDTLCSMNDLARCLVNNREPDEAQAMYARLLRVATTSLGPDDKLTQITRHNVAACRQAIQNAWGFSRLERQINQWIRQSRIDDQLERAVRLDRLRAIAGKLESRGRYRRALPLFEAWIGLSLAGSSPDDDEAIQNISQYARFLAKAGETVRSQSAYRTVIAIRNRQRSEGKGVKALRQALSDWGQSLAELGDHASARTTLALASRIA